MTLDEIIAAILDRAKFVAAVNGYVVPVDLVWELRRIVAERSGG